MLGIFVTPAQSFSDSSLKPSFALMLTLTSSLIDNRYREESEIEELPRPTQIQFENKRLDHGSPSQVSRYSPGVALVKVL